ncbi:MAG: dethiobiotin synthase [Nitrospirae bacterium]|nr:MAG: dethiobiotin synthase [Nitrospirota bacterium]
MVSSRPKGYWIVGTDTGVGKTVVVGAISVAFQAQGLIPAMAKPIETGVSADEKHKSDAARLASLLPPAAGMSCLCLYQFEMPLAPLAAARKAGMAMDLSYIETMCRSLVVQASMTLLEGVGGVKVPLTEHEDWLDLMVRLPLPCVVVGRAMLGGINHMLLTCEAILRRHLDIAAVVLNEWPGPALSETEREQMASTSALVRERLSIPVYGPLPFLATLSGCWRAGVHQLATLPDLQRLVSQLKNTVVPTR